jgi:hypothetical protein
MQVDKVPGGRVKILKLLRSVSLIPHVLCQFDGAFKSLPGWLEIN